MNIGKAKRLLVFFLSIAMMITMMPTSVFADGGGAAGGSNGTTTGGDWNHTGSGRMWVWFDAGGWKDSTSPGSGIAPVQGSYNKNTSSWITGSSGKTTYQYFVSANDSLLTKELRRIRSGKGDNTAYKYDYMKRKWLAGKNDTILKNQMVNACVRAVNRSHDPEVFTARVVGMAVSYRYGDFTSGSTWKDIWCIMAYKDDKTFTNMFGMKGKTTSQIESYLKKYLKDEDGWGTLVNPGEKNGVKTDANGNSIENWRQYVWRISKEDNKSFTARSGTRLMQCYVVAVADNEPQTSPEFATELKDFKKGASANEKIDATEMGNVKIEDEILYKNVDKDGAEGYKVSAELVMSPNVSFTPAPEVPVDDPETEKEDSYSDDNGGGSQSEDGVVLFSGKTVSIDDEAEAYLNYTDGKWWAVCLGKTDGAFDNNNVILTQELTSGDTTLDIPSDTLIAVYYMPEQPNPATDSPIVTSTYIAPEDSGEIDPGEADVDDVDDIVVNGQTIAKTNGIIKPTADFVKASSKENDWQRGSFVKLDKGVLENGSTTNTVDLYKIGLFNDVSDFSKVYTAGVKAYVYDGNTLKTSLNLDLKDPKEATELRCHFGTLTFDKQAVYNHKKASVVETGAKFQVYSKEFSSYDAAVADAKAKGYETYKYEMITIDSKTHQHAEGFTDYIDWQLHNGMLAPGTYVIKEVTAGDFSKSNQLVDPFEIVVKEREIGSPSGGVKIENPHYEYKLTVEKRSENMWRSEWEPSTEDPLFSKQTQFVLESMDDENNVMGNGSGLAPTATNKDGSLVSNAGYVVRSNTDPWTIEVDKLPSGRYRITEDAPIGYWLPKDKATVEFKVYRDMNGEVKVDDLKGHDAAFTKIDTRKEETADRTSYAVTFTRSNVPQGTAKLKLHKDRESQNAVGNTETEGFPYVEFNLYADPENPLTEAENDGGDIRAYDGHKDHVYYKAGQLIRGIQIDEETGERTYYNDGKVVSEETYRIMTDLNGDWDSSKIWNAADGSLKNEGLVAGGDKAFEHYPLTNNNLIDTYDKDGNATGEKDGVSHYKFQEMYIWEFGDHISFTDDEKAFLADQWTKNYTKEGTDYGSMDAKIGDIGLSMNQILNHGIDITENQDENGGRTGSKTYTYSSFGKELHDDVVEAFLTDKVLKYTDPANGVDDTKETIKNKNGIAVGEIEYNLLVLWPDQKTEFPKIDETFSEFQVLPDNVDETHWIETVLQNFTNNDNPILKTVAEVNETGTHEYASDADVVTIHDTVSYHNLVVGREYEMTGTLYNITNTPDGWTLGEPILDENGDPLTVTEKFVPTNKKDKLEMIFRVTPKQLNYDDVVVFERCKLADDLIVEEADPNVETQQIHTSGGSVIETQATYNGKHIMPNDSNVTFIDTVEYWGLTPGTKYTLKGTLMEKDGSETGVPVQVDEKDVVATYEFTAPAKHGKVDVPFNVNTSDLDGKTVVVFEELCDESGNPFDPAIEHKDINDDNQSIIIPSVETNASDEATQEHVGEKNKKTTVIDVVKYTNLIPGEKYTISGKLMKKPKADNTVAPVDENNKAESQIDDKDAQVKDEEGNVVQEGTPEAVEPYEVLAEASKSFTAEEANGSLELKFTVNSEDLSGYSAVAFETITDDATGVEIAIHRDINDPDQTIDYPDIKTTALDGNIKLHVGELGTTVSIIDTVVYENLTPGLEYEMSGELMDKATGDPLKIDGKPVRASQKFTPDSPNGSVDLSFELDSTKLGGTSVVAFEELTYNDVLVAEHKDIDDPEQTVDYPEIKTVAVDGKTKTHEGHASADVQIVDTVKYKNLTPGVEYTVRGILMDKETGDVYIANKGDSAGVAKSTVDAAVDAASNIADAVDKATGNTDAESKDAKAEDTQNTEDTKVEGQDAAPQAQTGSETATEDTQAAEDKKSEETVVDKTDGAEAEAKTPEAKKDVAVSSEPVAGAVWAEVKFTPTEKDGEVEIPFNIKNGDVAGKKLVAFESIYVVTEDGKEVEVGRHEDITDPDQTVGYPEIRTNAVDAESGEHVGLARQNITVRDKVTYKGLTPGQTYTVVGTLMDKETGKPIVAGADAEKMKNSQSGSNSGNTGDGTTTDAVKNLKPVGTAIAIDKQANIYNWGALKNVLQGSGYASFESYFGDEATNGIKNAAGTTFRTKFAGKDYGLAGIFTYTDGEETTIQMTNGESLPDGTTKLQPGESGSFYGIEYIPLCLNGESAFGLVTINVKNTGTTEEMMANCEIVSIDAHLEGMDTKPSEKEETTPAEKAAEGAQTSGAVTAQKTFTAENSEGSVEIEFVFSGVDMSNRAAVAFEKLYAGGKVEDNKLVATHEDINDPDQTVYYPTIDTKASYKDGVITDTVTYTNLIPGLEYELTGTLMDKKSGNSMEISAMTKFTPKEANGTVDMKFEVDKDKVAGKSIVVFETLKLNGKVVAEHHDINDKDQTVTIDKANPAKETKESKDAKKDADRSSYKTGDFMPYILMAALVMILTSIYVVQRRRRREE